MTHTSQLDELLHLFTPEATTKIASAPAAVAPLAAPAPSAVAPTAPSPVQAAATKIAAAEDQLMRSAAAEFGREFAKSAAAHFEQAGTFSKAASAPGSAPAIDQAAVNAAFQAGMLKGASDTVESFRAGYQEQLKVAHDIATAAHLSGQAHAAYLRKHAEALHAEHTKVASGETKVAQEVPLVATLPFGLGPFGAAATAPHGMAADAAFRGIGGGALGALKGMATGGLAGAGVGGLAGGGLGALTGMDADMIATLAAAGAMGVGMGGALIGGVRGEMQGQRAALAPLYASAPGHVVTASADDPYTAELRKLADASLQHPEQPPRRSGPGLGTAALGAGALGAGAYGLSRLPHASAASMPDSAPGAMPIAPEPTSVYGVPHGIEMPHAPLMPHTAYGVPAGIAAPPSIGVPPGIAAPPQDFSAHEDHIAGQSMMPAPDQGPFESTVPEGGYEDHAQGLSRAVGDATNYTAQNNSLLAAAADAASRRAEYAEAHPFHAAWNSMATGAANAAENARSSAGQAYDAAGRALGDSPLGTFVRGARDLAGSASRVFGDVRESAAPALNSAGSALRTAGRAIDHVVAGPATPAPLLMPREAPQVPMASFPMAPAPAQSLVPSFSTPEGTPSLPDLPDAGEAISSPAGGDVPNWLLQSLSR